MTSNPKSSASISKSPSAATAVAAVERHYTRSGMDIENTILTALKNAGKNIDQQQLTVDDLAPIDEFHTRGREATANLASLLNLQQTSTC